MWIWNFKIETYFIMRQRPKGQPQAPLKAKTASPQAPPEGPKVPPKVPKPAGTPPKLNATSKAAPLLQQKADGQDAKPKAAALLPKMPWRASGPSPAVWALYRDEISAKAVEQAKRTSGHSHDQAQERRARKHTVLHKEAARALHILNQEQQSNSSVINNGWDHGSSSKRLS